MDRVEKLFVAALVVLAAVFVPRLIVAYEPPPPQSPDALFHVVAALKLSVLAVGAHQAGRCVPLLGTGNPARRPWLLLALGLGFFFIGQCGLTVYQLVLRVPTPFPSIADAFFIGGLFALIAAAASFVAVYVRSGLAMGGTRELVGLAVASSIVLCIGAFVLLAPIATTPAPLQERVLNLSYPMLDLILLVPVAVLLRMTLRMRGGSMWKVWASLLLGFGSQALGDISFAYFTTMEVVSMDPVVDLSFAYSYTFLALGTYQQRRILES